MDIIFYDVKYLWKCCSGVAKKAPCKRRCEFKSHRQNLIKIAYLFMFKSPETEYSYALCFNYIGYWMVVDKAECIYDLN